jgi:hypothetical protein
MVLQKMRGKIFSRTRWNSGVAKAFIGLNESQLKILMDEGEIREVKYEEDEKKI